MANFLDLLSILLIGAALCITFGTASTVTIWVADRGAGGPAGQEEDKFHRGAMDMASLRHKLEADPARPRRGRGRLPPPR